ncbi:MAG: FtsQ-type POTRA domain-containing protein [Candidatus Sericytochromatia bacterium]|uniref:FtsQ-type POTRA domain-containing protein n=1 Tax=Candidatus Tanganyikabacteria bacterium TaxID=2961651 RepID=A0A937X2Q0_9BACT|nr:FtsQ-type POTRA domain-containing protein [Candidatus Tanganyikabacteria bacterium]
MKVVSVLYGLLAAGALAGAWAAPVWDWDGRTELFGASLVEKAAVARLLPEPGKPIFLLDPAPLEDRLEKISAVKDARVRRWAFPPRLEIRLTEREAAALLMNPAASDSSRIYLDPDGAAFSAHKALPRPTLTVLAREPSLGQTDRPAFAAVAAVWPRRTAGTLDVRNAASWRATIGGIPVLLGPPDDVPAKFRALQRLLPLAEGTRKTLQYVDVRFPDAPSFRVAQAKAQDEQGVATAGNRDRADDRRPVGHAIPQPGGLRQAKPSEPARRGLGPHAQPGREGKGGSREGSGPAKAAPGRGGERPERQADHGDRHRD